MRLEQAEAGQDAAGLSQLIVHGVVRVGADRPARGCGGDLVHTVKPGDLLDEINLALQVHPEGGDAEHGCMGGANAGGGRDAGRGVRSADAAEHGRTSASAGRARLLWSSR